eukprot:XP_001703153.1 MaoC-like dehydratase [Chlamydomonas reinhardtii]
MAPRRTRLGTCSPGRRCSASCHGRCARGWRGRWWGCWAALGSAWRRQLGPPAAAQRRFIADHLAPAATLPGLKVWAGDYNFVCNAAIDTLHRGGRLLDPGTTSLFASTCASPVDSFRHLHPTRRSFTFINHMGASRIDRIMLSPELLSSLRACAHVPGRPSDHRLVVATLAPVDGAVSPGPGLRRLSDAYLAFPDLRRSLLDWNRGACAAAPEAPVPLLRWFVAYKRDLVRTVGRLNRIARGRILEETAEEAAARAAEAAALAVVEAGGPDAAQAAAAAVAARSAAAAAAQRAVARHARAARLQWLRTRETASPAITRLVRPPGGAARIAAIRRPDGSVCDSLPEIPTHIVDYWRRISAAVATDPDACDRVLAALAAFGRRCTDEDAVRLGADTVSSAEVEAALAAAPAGSTPGRDGIPAELYRELGGPTARVLALSHSRTLGVVFYDLPLGTAAVQGAPSLSPAIGTLGTLCGLPLTAFGRGFCASSYAVSRVLYHMEFAGLPPQTVLADFLKTLVRFVDRRIIVATPQGAGRARLPGLPSDCVALPPRDGGFGLLPVVEHHMHGSAAGTYVPPWTAAATALRAAGGVGPAADGCAIFGQPVAATCPALVRLLGALSYLPPVTILRPAVLVPGPWCFALPLWGNPVLPCAAGLQAGGLERDFPALMALPGLLTLGTAVQVLQPAALLQPGGHVVNTLYAGREYVVWELGHVFPPCRPVALHLVRDERRLQPHVTAYGAVRVLGPLLGSWAVDLYGVRPVRVDELLHLRTHLEVLYEQVRQGLDESRHDLPYVPTAFVTFSSTTARGCCGWHLARCCSHTQFPSAPYKGYCRSGGLRSCLCSEPCRSQVDFRTTTLVFGFQVVAVFVASFLAGALLNQIGRFVSEPGAVLTVLGTGAPQTASFFLTYILFTHRPAAGCVNPLVLPAAAAHFLLSGLLERHSHCYVWAREYESGGRMWSQLVCGWGAAAHRRLVEEANVMDRSSLRREVHVGAEASVTRAFSAEEVKHFVLLTGDANPIHASDVAAKTAGFSAPVLPGILVASLFPAIIGSQFPGTVYVSQTLRFRSPALVGEPVTATVTVRKVSGRRVAFDTSAVLQHSGAVVVDGEALALMPHQQQ